MSTKHIDMEYCIETVSDLSNLFENSRDNSELEKPTMDTLRFLWDQSNLLFDLVQNRDESEGRSGKDYFDGVKLGDLSYQLSKMFGKRGLYNPQELALRIRLKAILQVQGHYHHIIGPAMLEHSAVLETLGRDDEAQDNYDCIISDFSWFIDEYGKGDTIDNQDDLESLRALKQAIEKRYEAFSNDIDKASLKSKLEHIKALLGV